MGEVVRVLVLHPHALWRRGLCDALADEPDLDVVAQVPTVVEAVAALARTAVNVVVAPADELVEVAAARPAQVRGVGVLDAGDPVATRRAVEAGAGALVEETCEPGEVLDALRAVAAGRGWIAEAVVPDVLDALRSAGPGAVTAAGPVLTRREREVLAALVLGRRNRDIAETLFISENTVKNHVRNIFDKLGVHSRAEAAWWAVRNGVVDAASG